MMNRIAINGFGRIGRMILRAYLEKPQPFNIVAINDLIPIDMMAHLFKYDSIHGPYRGSISIESDCLVIDGKRIQVFSKADPCQLPFDTIDVVLECSGHFTTHKDAMKHCQAGAKRVLVSAPVSDADLTVVYGVNHQLIQGNHTIISNASCTTNCLAPLAMILDQTLGIEKGFMTTIHAYTGDQRLVDMGHKDYLRARSAPLSMVPSTTGAAKALGLILPQLAGKLDGVSLRVPTPNVSVVDFTFTSRTNTTVTNIQHIITEAAKDSTFQGVLAATYEPCVSIDYNHNRHSCTVDMNQIYVVENNFVRVLAWYDNEWGFSNRMLDVTQHMLRG